MFFLLRIFLVLNLSLMRSQKKNLVFRLAKASPKPNESFMNLSVPDEICIRSC